MILNVEKILAIINNIEYICDETNTDIFKIISEKIIYEYDYTKKTIILKTSDINLYKKLNKI